MTRPSYRLMIELAKMVARNDPDKSTKPGQMAHDALAAMTREDNMEKAAQAGGDGVHVLSAGRIVVCGEPDGAAFELLERRAEVAPQRGGPRVEVGLEYRDEPPRLQRPGGCQGCGMVDVTLRNGIEKTLRERIPEVTGVRDVTDHASGAKPYYGRRTG